MNARTGESAVSRTATPGNWFEEFFELGHRQSTLKREVTGGIATFLALSYIFVVNPAILSSAGMDRGAVMVATILVSGLSTILMGLWARLPFAVAPGMEMNAYVAFFVVGTLGFSWEQALGMVFWSGVAMIVATFSSLRERVIDSIADSMKVSLAFSVGVFLIVIALSIAGIFVYEGVVFERFGSVASPGAYALYIGAALVFLLERLRVPGAVLLSILATSALCPLLGVRPDVHAATSAWRDLAHTFVQLDLSCILDLRCIGVVLVLFVLDFYGSVAKFIALTLNTSIIQGGKVPRRTHALLVDGAASTAASMVGTTSIITFVESAVGIGMGARTGLCAVTCGVLMLLCFVAMPWLQYVPIAATTGALIYVGVKLFPPANAIKSLETADRCVLFAMPMVVVATFAIDRAMLVGFTVHVLVRWYCRKAVNPFVVASTAVIAIATVLQMAA